MSSVTIDAKIVCWFCEKNEGRYLGGILFPAGVVATRILCGTCAIENKVDAIKMDDVPALLAWCRDLLQDGALTPHKLSTIRSLIGRAP